MTIVSGFSLAIQNRKVRYKEPSVKTEVISSLRLAEGKGVEFNVCIQKLKFELMLTSFR